MTTMNDPIKRLWEHAGLPEREAEIPRDTLAEFVFQVSRSGSDLDLNVITEDIIRCMDVLNRHVNGLVPSETIEGKQREISRELAYAASGIVSKCLDKAIELQLNDPGSAVARDLLVAAWRIQCAWDQLLAGDIDDLRQSVSDEENARFGSL